MLYNHLLLVGNITTDAINTPVATKENTAKHK